MRAWLCDATRVSQIESETLCRYIGEEHTPRAESYPKRGVPNACTLVFESERLVLETRAEPGAPSPKRQDSTQASKGVFPFGPLSVQVVFFFFFFFFFFKSEDALGKKGRRVALLSRSKFSALSSPFSKEALSKGRSGRRYGSPSPSLRRRAPVLSWFNSGSASCE